AKLRPPAPRVATSAPGYATAEPSPTAHPRPTPGRTRARTATPGTAPTAGGSRHADPVVRGPRARTGPVRRAGRPRAAGSRPSPGRDRLAVGVRHRRAPR